MTRQPVAAKPQTGPAVAKGLAALGVAPGATTAVAFGVSAAVAKALPAALGVQSIPAIDSLSDLEGDFDLIVVGEGVATLGLAETRNRVAELALRLRPGGELAAWLSTLAAPLDGVAPAAAYDALLFPEPAAAGDLGEAARATTLSASGWMMLFHACGLECVAQAGLGESPLPDSVAVAHAPRLAAFDPVELTTGRFLARFRRRGDA
ncbi:MAG: hypothetical protein EON88_06590 [Brevundimonas sp.]|nr:MAG: hypothetical protein EON88_06590 [Brevundimonas sp.]